MGDWLIDWIGLAFQCVSYNWLIDRSIDWFFSRISLYPLIDWLINGLLDRNAIFIIHFLLLQNVSTEDAKKIPDIIKSTIDRVVKTGFEVERVEALLHEMELYLKHETTSFGLHLLFGLMSSWTHDSHPIDHIKVNEVVNRFREAIASDPELLQKKVKEYLQVITVMQVQFIVLNSRQDLFTLYVHLSISRLIDRLIDQPIVWLFDLLFDRLIDWSFIVWLIDWLIDHFIVRFFDWLIDWLSRC